VAAGRNASGQLDVGSWSGIVQVAAGGANTVGLKSDGTVVAVGDNSYNQLDVGSWTGIVQVAVGGASTVGLKSDGTVVAVGDNSYNQLDVGSWTDIVQVAAGYGHTVGLKSDGTILAVGNNEYGQCTMSDWHLGAVLNRSPIANAGPDQTVEATSPSSASVTLDGTASSDPDGSITTFTWTGDFGTALGATPTVALSVGTHTITLTVTDNGGLTGMDTVQVTVIEVPPIANAGSDQTVPAGATCAASVSLDGTGSSDPNAGSLTFTWTGDFGTASGATPTVALSMGSHTITLMVTDNGGLTASDTVIVTVLDTTPPLLVPPAPIVAEQTRLGGASVSLPSPTASDNCGFVAVVSNPASDSMFPPGTTMVTFTATDGAGNTATATTTVTIQDTTAPVLTVPTDIIVESVDVAGAPVVYTVTASDIVDGVVTPTCSPASGTVFPVGATTVSCTAVDLKGNSSSVSFHVLVTTNPDRSGGAVVPPDTGGTITTPDGSITIEIPPGALNANTYISVAETGTSYELTSNLGNGTAVYGITIQPDGTVFNVPITITFTWADATMTERSTERTSKSRTSSSPRTILL